MSVLRYMIVNYKKSYQKVSGTINLEVAKTDSFLWEVNFSKHPSNQNIVTGTVETP